MLEIFVGTSFVCGVFICGLFLILEFIALKFNLKKCEDDASNSISDYITSIIVFMFISIVVLLFAIVFYVISIKDNAVYNSGLIFLIIEFLSGSFIRFVYYGISKIVNKVIGFTFFHSLKEYEMTWTWLFICGSFAAAFFIFGECTIALTFLVIVLSYFVSFDSNIRSILKKINGIAELSVSYWFVIILIVFCSFISIRYESKIQIVAALTGIIPGFFLYIACRYVIRKRTGIKCLTCETDDKESKTQMNNH